MSGPSWMGLAVGVAAGVAAGLLVAPMRGTQMRANLRTRAADGGARLQTLASSGRDWAQHALDRATSLMEDGRRALQTGSASSPTATAPTAGPLTASMGEISQLHTNESDSYEGRI